MRKPARRRPRDAGFTLIELLLVIVVLAILAGIAILYADGAREHAINSCEAANERVDATRDGVEAVRGEKPDIISGGSC